MATYYSNTNNTYRLRLDVTNRDGNSATNQSVIEYSFYLDQGNKRFNGLVQTGNLTIDGVSRYTKPERFNSTEYPFNSYIALASGSFTVTHTSDGSKTVSLVANFSANSGGNGPVGLAINETFVLTTIPRYAAITAFNASISGLTASLSWTADKTISQWRYSTNSGSSYSAWTTVNATSGSKSLSVSASTTYGFRVQVRSSASGLDTTSSTISRTSPAAAKITAFTASINDRSASLSWTSDKTISQWRYSTNSGSSYSGWTTVNAKSGSVSSIGVSPGSTYGFRVQVKDSETGLDTTSSIVSKTATKTPSTLTLSTTSQNMGSTITWTVNESYDYTHKVTYAFGNTSGYILGSGSAASNTASGTWTVPTALANQIPSATSGSGTIYVYTYYGSVHVGTNSYTFTAKVPNDTTWQPTVPTVTISDAGTRPAGITSYVQGIAKAKVVSSSTAQGGASISSYQVTVSGIGTYYGSTITSGFLTKSGTVTITVRATDSRGYYREKSNTITVVEYSPPKLTTYTATRSPNDQGLDLATSINFTISSVSSQNTKQYRIRYKSTDGGWVVLVDSTGYYTRSTTHSATGVLNANNSYEVEFYIKDSYTSVTQTINIGTAFQLMDFRASGRGMAIGKVSESDSFEVGMPARFHKGIEVLDTRAVNSVPQELPGNAVSFEFKRNSAVDNPPVTATTTYSHIINVSGWSSNEGSGGWPTQISVGASGFAVRQATSATTWGSWQTVGGISSVSWNDILSKPSTFAPSSHTHAWSQVTGAPAQATRWPSWSEVTSKPSTFTPSAHNQAWSTITSQPATATRWPTWSEVSSKPTTFAPSAHNQAWSTITSQPATATRWPTWAEVTGKPSTFAPTAHTHPMTMTNLLAITSTGAGVTRTLSASITSYDMIIVVAYHNFTSVSNTNVSTQIFIPSLQSVGGGIWHTNIFQASATYRLIEWTFPAANQIKLTSQVNSGTPAAAIQVIGVKNGNN